MTILSNILSLANQLLIFYIPTFYTFKFLMSNNKEKVRTILKFWCVLTIYHLFAWILSQIIAQEIFPLIHLIILIGLNWKQFEYAQTIFDQFISPTYKNNREQLENITKKLEQIFNKKTSSLKQKVSESTAQKFKGFIGQILVGTLNPTQKRKEQKRQNQDSDQSDKQQ